MSYAPSGSNRNRRKCRLVIIKSSRMGWAGHVACMGKKRNVYEILMGKPEGKRPLQRPRCRLEDNVKIELRENRLGWYGLD
jgi:hypothetical protein